MVMRYQSIIVVDKFNNCDNERAWCRKNIGQFDLDWSLKWHSSLSDHFLLHRQAIFLFNTEEQRVMFESAFKNIDIKNYYICRIPYNYAQIKNIRIWCNKNIGSNPIDWQRKMSYSDSSYTVTYYFRTKEHQTLFELTWL